MSIRIVNWIVSKKGAWLTLIVMGLLGLGIAGGLRGFEVPNSVGTVPAAAESSVSNDLAEEFSTPNESSVLAVFVSQDGSSLSEAVLTDIEDGSDRFATFRPLGSTSEVFGPISSEDGEAAILSIPVKTAAFDVSGELVDIPNTEMTATIESLRSTAQELAPDVVEVWVTGGPAFGADIAGAFDGANFILLAVTIGIVALLLLVTYRSPILWLIPLAVVGLADGAAGSMTAMTGELSGLGFDTGIISVLVFGAGTNYALLLISRYREELRHTSEHRLALGKALMATTPAIVASNLTVVAALATLLLGLVPSTRGLGLAAAVGLVFAMAFVLIMLPALLAITGRKVFWPFIPQPGHVTNLARSGWFRIANSVTRFRLPVLVSSISVLALMGLPLLSTSIGLTKTEQFRVSSESATGFDKLGEHFPAGEADPMMVTTLADHADELRKNLSNLDGVVRVGQPEDSLAGDLVRFSVVSETEPDSAQAYRLLEQVRTTVHGDVDSLNLNAGQVLRGDIGGVVGGSVAESYDLLQASVVDLWTIVPLVLIVVLIVLVLLLKALVGPLVFMGLNILSAVAALGAGTWIGKTFFHFPALDVHVPLLAFIFLVALGIDYTIFIAHRTKLEASHCPTRIAVTVAVGHTGVVVTSAGIVLAAVFAALGVLPLVTLGQIGLIVGLGVLIDTLFVRAIVVPAAIAVLGEKTWWPTNPNNSDPDETMVPRASVTASVPPRVPAG